MSEILNWFLTKDNKTIEYLKGTKEAVELYIKELQKEDFDSDYLAIGSDSDFNENIKFKELA